MTPLTPWRNIMKKYLAISLITGIVLTSFLAPVEASALTQNQIITQQMLINSVPFLEVQANVLNKMNKVEQLKKSGASYEKIMAAQAEVDEACKLYNDTLTPAYSPLTYYGVYPMHSPDYDTLAYTNIHDYKLSVLHETTLIQKNDLAVECTQGVASNTLWLMNECKAELDAMEIKVKDNPTLQPQLDELRAMYSSYQARYLEEEQAANGAKYIFDNSVDTFPSAQERNGVNAYSYLPN